MYKKVRIDKRALRVILNALNEKTGDCINVNDLEFIAVSNMKYGYFVLFRSYRPVADIDIVVFTGDDNDLRYISADLHYTDHFETVEMTYNKLCSLMEEQI